MKFVLILTICMGELLLDSYAQKSECTSLIRVDKCSDVTGCGSSYCSCAGFRTSVGLKSLGLGSSCNKCATREGKTCLKSHAPADECTQSTCTAPRVPSLEGYQAGGKDGEHEGGPGMCLPPTSGIAQ